MKTDDALMTVSTRSVRPVVERLRALGLDTDTLLDRAGADPAVLDDPDARIPHALAIAVWHAAAEESGDDEFGLHTAEQIRAGAFDVLDYAIRSSATLGEGLERLVRYHRVLHDAARVQLDREGDVARLTHALPGDTATLPRQVAEFIVAAWVVVARQASGVHFSPVEVTFRHAAPADLTEHRRVFGARIRFGAEANGIVFAHALLDTPLVKADLGLCAVLERHVRELLDKAPNTTALSDRVRQLLANSLTHTSLTAESVARRLHMSRRTLQRELSAEHTTFNELFDGLRRELAVRYLCERRIAVAEVAFLLGFSEASAFHRAFKRWTGTSPAAYRKASLTGEDD